MIAVQQVATVPAAIIPVAITPVAAIRAEEAILVVVAHREGGEKMNAKRLFKHLLATRMSVRRAFPAESLDAITKAVKASEQKHGGELRFIIEGQLPLVILLKDRTSRQRAIDLFRRLRIGDTAEKSGTLIYLQMVDRRVEILADRGIAAKAPQAEWDAVCRNMEEAFSKNNYLQGALHMIDQITHIMIMHYPAKAENPNELPDEAQIL